MTTIKKVYKIRRKTDGLYSTGGVYPKFTKIGKVWSSLGHLKSHMRQLFDTEYSSDWKTIYVKLRIKHIYKDCEIVTYIVTEDDNNIIEMSDMIKEAIDKEKEDYHYTNRIFLDDWEE